MSNEFNNMSADDQIRIERLRNETFMTRTFGVIMGVLGVSIVAGIATSISETRSRNNARDAMSDAVRRTNDVQVTATLDVDRPCEVIIDRDRHL